MLPALFLVLLAVPVAELYVIVQVARGIGTLETLGLLLAISLAGAWLLKQQGIAAWRRLQKALQQGRLPGREVTDGAMILLGGALLLTPGFITDAVGLLLLVPATRAALKGFARRGMVRWARTRFRVDLYEADVVDRPRSQRPGSPGPAPRGPLPPRPGEDDSRDRR